MKRETLAVAAMLAVAAIATPANAATFDSLATSWMTSLGIGAKLIGVVAYVAAAGIGIAGVMKLKAASKNANDPNAKYSTGLIYLGAAALLVALPTLLGSGVDTIFGTGASKTNGTDGFGLSIQ